MTSLRDKAWELLQAHPALTLVLLALVVAGTLALTFWFVVFSGLASSADFIYSQF
ncbi:MAG: hypothetical protein PUE49_05040 [Eggerthellales bacterium]|nr:hypothetical protein [Eggerthellales bacterium]